MAELSFLTIIISLAVCSLLVYAAFQYMKVRLSILEQSHKEQAMILQQYIEESSTDIHRLYQMTTTAISKQDNNGEQFSTHDSIILEYANDNASKEENGKPVAYNQPHTIHLDTAAFFQNKRASNLIEISSDSEDTTESESNSDEYSDSTTSETEDEQDDQEDQNEESSDNEESDDDNNALSSVSLQNDHKHDDHHEQSEPTEVTPQSSQLKEEHAIVSEIVEIVCEEAPEIKTVTIDLGLIQEPDGIKSTNDSVLAMMYKKAQQTPLLEDDGANGANGENDANTADDTEPVFDGAESASEPLSTPAPTSTQVPPVHVPFTAMSVADLKLLLKEKCKHQPEKHAEIQKLKKAELIYALQQLQ